MIKKIASLALAVLLVGSMTSCILDPKKEQVKDNDPPVSDYKDRTEKWHVLHNINVAYNGMEAEPYVRLLDENFINFFYPGDVGTDGVPVQWFYDEEVSSSREMLNKGGGRLDNAILSIDLQLANVEQASWIEVTPDQVKFPDETWYAATVGYNFFFDTTNDIQFITSGTPNVQFTVRQQTDGKWKLVQWRDLAGG
jgi:hypothetical protein